MPVEQLSEVDTIAGLPASRIVSVINDLVDREAEVVALLLVGSLAQGLGTPSSDIDLYVLCEHADRLSFDEIALEIDGVIVDAQVHALERTRKRLAAVTEWDGAIGGNHSLPQIPDGEREFCHRILTARVLAGDLDRVLGAGMDARLRDRLQNLKLLVASHHARSLQVDAHGAVLDNDFVLAADLAQTGLRHAFDAVAAGFGETAVNPKWRLRFLSRLVAGNCVDPGAGRILLAEMTRGIALEPSAETYRVGAAATAAIRALLAAAELGFATQAPPHFTSVATTPVADSGMRSLRFDLDLHVSGDTVRFQSLMADYEPFDGPIDLLDHFFHSDPHAAIRPCGVMTTADADIARGLNDWIARHASLSLPL